MLFIIEVDIIFPIFLGNALSEWGKKEDAIIDNSKAIEINSLFSIAYYNRGMIDLE